MADSVVCRKDDIPCLAYQKASLPILNAVWCEWCEKLVCQFYMLCGVNSRI